MSSDPPKPSELVIRPVEARDLEAISALHRSAFGPGRFARTAYRVREATPAITPHCRAAFIGDRMVAALRMTPITIGGSNGALLLGPVAVEPDQKGSGFGKTTLASSEKLALL